MSWTNAFKDARGDWNVAECAGVPGAVAAISMWLWKAAHHPDVPDLQSFGIGLGAVIAAIGAAQRLRGDADLDRRDRDGHSGTDSNT